jgi:hypothetical protein
LRLTTIHFRSHPYFIDGEDSVQCLTSVWPVFDQCLTRQRRPASQTQRSSGWPVKCR